MTTCEFSELHDDPDPANLAKMHVSHLRQMVQSNPDVSPIAKANRFYLTKAQLISNLVEAARRRKSS